MPLLSCDAVIGCVNASNLNGNFRVNIGYVGSKPDAPQFRPAFDAEVERFRAFLIKR